MKLLKVLLFIMGLVSVVAAPIPQGTAAGNGKKTNSRAGIELSGISAGNGEKTTIDRQMIPVLAAESKEGISAGNGKHS